MLLSAPNRSLASLLASQCGLLTVEQADALGLDRRATADALHSGEAHLIIPGVVRVGPPKRYEPIEIIHAHWLKFAPAVTQRERLESNITAVGSHETAAYLLGLVDVPFDKPTFIVVRPEQTSADIRVLRGQLYPSDWTMAEGVPVTTPVTTIVDLLVDNTELDEVASAAVLALDKGMIKEAELESALEPHAHKHHLDVGESIVDLLRSIEASNR